MRSEKHSIPAQTRTTYFDGKEFVILRNYPSRVSEVHLIEFGNSISHFSMLRLMEHGIANRHYRRIYTTKPDCTGRIAMFTSATLLDTLPAFIIIAWGFVGALGILLCEKLYTQFGHRFIHYVHKNDKL